MSNTAVRERPPHRCRSWTQKAKIGGQTCYMTVGEYSDGRPCELSIDVSKCGTMVRGVLDDMARIISVALQHGTPIRSVVRTVRSSSYPPNGEVAGSSRVADCTSIVDWVMSELEHAYMQPPQDADTGA
jgi:ribonucleoside-diphosphate reductase alpha chain